jgi:hypothetical protein
MLTVPEWNSKTTNHEPLQRLTGSHEDPRSSNALQSSNALRELLAAASTASLCTKCPVETSW